MNLKKYFNPSSIAIVGISQHIQKVGHLVAKNMRQAGYKGSMYFVHPTEKELFGQKVYNSLLSIKKKIDLVIFATPAHITVPMLDQVHKIDCQNVLIYAAGFKEIHSPEGDELEKALLEKVNKYKLTLLGPNCIGFINTSRQINATFLKQGAPIGNIGIISQSGALGSAIVDTLSSRINLGISYFISLGNKSMMDESDCLRFLGDDPNTKVIGMYLEDVAGGEKFRMVLTSVAKKKPVVLLKGGATQAGSQAAMSHTGSMVGDDQVFESVCKQSYAIRAHTYKDFYELLKMYSYDALPSSRNILVLSNAGGMGVLLADQLIQSDLSLVVISEKTKQKLYGAFNESKKITVHNPIDLLGDASAFDYQKAIQSTSAERHVGAVIVLLTPQANTEIMPTAEVLAKAQKKIQKTNKNGKPIYPVFMGESSVKEARQFFEQNKMSNFIYFDGVPRLLGSIIERKEYIDNDSTSSHTSLFRKLKSRELQIRTILTEHASKDFLNQYNSLKVLEHSGLTIAHTHLATKEADLAEIVNKEGFPLVAKIASEKITHKTEVKGVITGINNWDELGKAYQHFISVSGKRGGCYVQKQYSGYELIVGAKRDNTFGTVILLGLGGIYAELLKEVVQFVYPYTFSYFERTVVKTKLNKFIKGYRNMPPLNLKALYESSLKLGELMNRLPVIKEIDINPLIVTEEDMIVADGRVIIDHSL